MKYSEIVNLISKQLADELVSEDEMLSYMDRVIDDINARLDTVFPTFTEYKMRVYTQPDMQQDPELNSIDLDYVFIPDKYIRTVVIPGAAFKYYTTDEEGGFAAPKYEADYIQNLFYMERDYSFSVPEKYRAKDQGFIECQGYTDAGLQVGVNRGMF